MKLPSTAQIVGKIVVLQKKHTAQVEKYGNVCITEAEIKSIQNEDIVTIEVRKKDGTLVGSRTYTGKAFHAALRTRERVTKGGTTIEFKVIKCL